MKTSIGPSVFSNEPAIAMMLTQPSKQEDFISGLSFALPKTTRVFWHRVWQPVRESKTFSGKVSSLICRNPLSGLGIFFLVAIIGLASLVGFFLLTILSYGEFSYVNPNGFWICSVTTVVSAIILRILWLGDGEGNQ